RDVRRGGRKGAAPPDPDRVAHRDRPGGGRLRREGGGRGGRGRLRPAGGRLARPARGHALLSRRGPQGRSRPRRARGRRPEVNDEQEDPKQIATGSTLADISIRNHVLAWMLMAGLILF